MVNYNDLSTLKQRYSAVESDELIKILTKDFNNYTPEALEAARSVISSRGITDIEIPNSTVDNIIEEKEVKPVIRIITRIVLYFFWSIICMLLIIFHGSIKDSLRLDIVAFLQNNLGIESIRTVALIYGAISASITILLFFIFIKGFLAITKETRSRGTKRSLK